VQHAHAPCHRLDYPAILTLNRSHSIPKKCICMRKQPAPNVQSRFQGDDATPGCSGLESVALAKPQFAKYSYLNGQCNKLVPGLLESGDQNRPHVLRLVDVYNYGFFFVRDVCNFEIQNNLKTNLAQSEHKPQMSSSAFQNFST
jgi:hypothetical protein